MDVTQKLMLRVVSNSKAENILITATKSKMISWKKKIARIEGSYELKIWWVKYGLSLTSPLGITDWTSGARDAAVKFTCETFVAWAFVCRKKYPLSILKHKQLVIGGILTGLPPENTLKSLSTSSKVVVSSKETVIWTNTRVATTQNDWKMCSSLLIIVSASNYIQCLSPQFSDSFRSYKQHQQWRVHQRT